MLPFGCREEQGCYHSQNNLEVAERAETGRPGDR